MYGVAERCPPHQRKRRVHQRILIVVRSRTVHHGLKVLKDDGFDGHDALGEPARLGVI